MSIRSTIAFADNESGTMHLYSEAGGGDICINVTVKEGSKDATYYGDMYLTLQDLAKMHKEIGEILDWYKSRAGDNSAILFEMITSHKYDDEVGTNGKTLKDNA
jgi:hypothetical protein